MSKKVPIDLVALTELMRSPIILRIVAILDITSLSILELFEYRLTLKDVNYAMANGVITDDKITKLCPAEILYAYLVANFSRTSSLPACLTRL